MNKITVFLSAFLLLLNSNQLLAQGHYNLDPYNIPFVTDEIFTDYTTDIFIPESAVAQHLATLVDPLTYSAGMSNASLDVSFVGDEKVSLNWADQGVGISYKVAYQNLKNGVVNFYTIPEGTTNLLLDNMIDGLYAFSISSYSGGIGPPGGISSFADIIIIEKIIFRYLGPSGSACDCETSEMIFEQEDELGFATTSIPWTPDLNKKYVLKIQYVNSNYDDAYVSYIPKINTNGTSEGFLFYPDCLGNVWHPEIPTATSILYAYDENNRLQLGMSYTDYTWYLLHLSQPVMKSVTLKSCAIDKSEADQRDSNAQSNLNTFAIPDLQITMYPNPAREEINFLIPIDSKQSNVEINIYDQAGQLTLIKSSRSNDIKMNIAVLPAGIYTARINTGRKVVTERFVKLN